MEIKSSEFFKNMRRLPKVGTKAFDDLVKWEVEKCQAGVSIQGIRFSGWLYWHLNHWHIGLDKIDKYGNSVVVADLPPLRDIEWERAEAIERCEKFETGKKGYIEIGARRQGKSDSLASILTHSAHLFENTQNAIITGNKYDQDVIIQKVEFGHTKMWEGLKISKLDKSWKNSLLRLGYKDKENNDHVWSTIAIRNADDGNNTEVAAGLTVRVLILDEIGKFPFGQVITAAKPTLLTPHGWRGLILLCGTGGSFSNGADAERYFFYPEENGFLGFTQEDGRVTGNFLSGEYRMDCKHSTNLAKYLIGRGQDLSEKQIAELSQVPIEVSDKEEARRIILHNRELKKGDPDRTEYLKEIMYFPLTIDECFLTDGENFFNEVLAKQHQDFLYASGKYLGDNCRLTEVGGIVHCEVVTDDSISPITTFPVSSNESKEGCIVIYEHPIENPPFGLYVGGCLPTGEEVMTNKGLMKIEDVGFNNKLISESGEEVEIYNLQRYKKENEDMYEVSLHNTLRKTKFTKEHPLKVSDTYTNKDNRLDESSFNFEFVEMSRVKSNQWVKMPIIYKKEKEFVNKDLPISEEGFWWLVGLYLGDGWINKNKICFAINKKEENYLNKVKQIVSTLFLKEVYVRKRDNCYEVSFSNKVLRSFLERYVGKSANNKYIDEPIKYLPKNLKAHLILGYFNSYGCSYLDKKRNIANVEFSSISPQLLEDVQDILFSLDITSSLTSLREGKEGVPFKKSSKIHKTHKTYHLRFGNYEAKKFLSYFEDIYYDHKLDIIKKSKVTKNFRRANCFISSCGNFIYYQIKDIKLSKYTGWVYNFECETHTYCTKNITTHNCDPYKQDQAASSDSLGAVYIFKRLHDISSETYQDMIVAQYTGRPATMDEWCDNTRKLIKYYNALTLVENEDIYFIKYMQAKHEDYYLADEQPFLKALIPTSTVNRSKGFHAATKIINYLNTSLKLYMEEEIMVERDEDGSTINVVNGVVRIPDVMLLEEIRKFRPGGNYDRIRAASAAVTLARHLDPFFIVGNSNEKRKEENSFRKRVQKRIKKQKLFGTSRKIF